MRRRNHPARLDAQAKVTPHAWSHLDCSRTWLLRGLDRLRLRLRPL